jgi:hypothetical protein
MAIRSVARVRRKKISARQGKAATSSKRWREADPDTAAILEKVHHLMRERSVTLAELAFRTGWHPTTLYQHLHPEPYGLGPLRITDIRAFAKGLSVPIHDLLAVVQE